MSITAMFVYNPVSGGGADLAEAVGIPRIKHLGSKFKGSASKTLINWGCSSERLALISSAAEIAKCSILNPPSLVDVACDKVKTFNLFQEKGVSAPEFTTSKAQATQWLEQGIMVFARTQLRAHSGRGIVIMDPDHQDTWEVSAPLYVKYIPKKHEYRIHVLKGQVLDIQRKGLREDLKGSEGVNFKIRNLQNGFIYVRNDSEGTPLISSSKVPTIVKTVGIEAVNALGLDFGAADVILNEKSGRAYALEVNCAPGLSGTTVTNYANALRSL
jgi:carbamoylphosphate synthase large subunit